MGAGGRDGVLGGEHFRRASRRNGVGHVEHGRHAAEGRGRGARAEILLVGIAGIAKMNMHVDGAGQDMQARGVERFDGRGHGRVVADGDDKTILDGDAGDEIGVRRHHRAVANDEIGDHGFPHRLAQPPSTGRSTPVIWRAASLARNRQALATSTSVETRLSA